MTLSIMTLIIMTLGTKTPDKKHTAE
jgi:hypothetical protein